MHYPKTLLTLCFVMVAVLPGCFGYFMKRNDSTYLEIPPLFYLDEWALCQRPKDVYCMVDAALTSSKPSPLLDFLKMFAVVCMFVQSLWFSQPCLGKHVKPSVPVVFMCMMLPWGKNYAQQWNILKRIEYSSDTQKHYNRTLVHRGVCISKCGAEGPETWRGAAERCLNNNLAHYELEAEILAVQFCNTPETVYTHPSTGAFNIVTLSLLAIAILATVIHIFGGRCTGFSENKFILAFSLKRNWQILKRIKSEKELNDRTKDLLCLEGIRFVGTLGVIFTHTSITYVYSYIDNPEYIEHMFDQFSAKVAFNTPLWIQAFFSISGFLITYLSLIYSETNTLTILKCILSIIHRYIRLTPVALYALWFTMTWYPRLGEGPQWAWLIQREAEDCTERWWYHAIYVHNYLPLGKYCMGHTWYLAVDMQLHVVGLVLLFIFLRWRSTVKPIISVLLVGSTIATGLVVYFFNLTPIITSQAPEIVNTMFKGSRILPILYLPLWMNLSGYLLGIATAFIYYHHRTIGYKLSEVKWFRVAFHSSLPLAGAVSLAGVLFLAQRAPPLGAAAAYGALDRGLIALGFCVFLLGCVSRCHSILREALLWRGFQVIGRLTYSVFVVHFIIMRMIVACNTQIGHVSGYSMISLLVVGIVLSYIVSVPIYLFVEMPAIQLWKALTSSDSKKDSTNREPPIKIDIVTSRSNTEQSIA